MDSISLDQIENLSGFLDDLVMGVCVNPSCQNPDKFYLAFSTFDQGGAIHINALSKCFCGKDNCLIKDGGVICFDCVGYCHESNPNDLDQYICSLNVLEKCEKCNKRYCGEQMFYYGSGCLSCEHKCGCGSN
jgi:hypothetical protein